MHKFSFIQKCNSKFFHNFFSQIIMIKKMKFQKLQITKFIEIFSYTFYLMIIYIIFQIHRYMCQIIFFAFKPNIFKLFHFLLIFNYLFIRFQLYTPLVHHINYCPDFQLIIFFFHEISQVFPFVCSLLSVFHYFVLICYNG